MSSIDPCRLFSAQLSNIQKPARYLGGESGSTSKMSADFRIALCFPDLYEIGMTNNALKILYSRLNALEGVSCERVFSVGLDYEKLLRDTGTPLYSLETGTPIAEFDMLAFTIGYELAATNVLAVLDLSGIPLLSDERRDDHPMVIAGGPAITNPLPYSSILDAVWIGEAEDRFFEVIAAMRQEKLVGSTKKALLRMLIDESAVWIRGKKALRNVYDDFGSSLYPYSFPSPIVKPIQDHGVVEIMRGCPNGCRFCHAGYFYRPRRLRSVERIMEDVEAQVTVAGHKEISLSSLSSGDYPGIVSLVELLSDRWGAEGVSFQLPSLKVESFPLEILDKLSGTRKSGLTFAIETPLDQWQMTINKRVGLQKIVAILDEAGQRGYRLAKFYFMIGLPLPLADSAEDDAIISFIRSISAAAPKMKLNINVATFVPKPHTPFQWSAQLPPAEAASRIYKIKDSFRGDARIKISYHAPYLSWLEGLIARGDERVGGLIISAFRNGTRFDAWDDLFMKEYWESALNSSGLDLSAMISEKDIENDLPWSDISLRVSKQFLIKERARSLESTMTGICKDDCDRPCGACSADHALSANEQNERHIADVAKEISKSHATTPRNAPPSKLGSDLPTKEERLRLMFKYEKRSGAAFYAHHEVRSMITSAFERSGLSFEYSKGFNPMPRLEISEPLPLGFDSIDEYGVAILDTSIDGNTVALMESINALLPRSIRILDFLVIRGFEGIKFPSLSSAHWGSMFTLDPIAAKLDPDSLCASLLETIRGKPLLVDASVESRGGLVEVVLPFTGIRELGLSSLFEASILKSIRDAGVFVIRNAQYAKSASGGREKYFEHYKR